MKCCRKLKYFRKQHGNGTHVLQEEDVTALSVQECNSIYNNVTYEMFCAVREIDDVQYDSCVGDSGGPLIKPGVGDEGDIQVAIVSWGAGCTKPYSPGVYARISEQYEWIQSYIYKWTGTCETDAQCERPGCGGICGENKRCLYEGGFFTNVKINTTTYLNEDEALWEWFAGYYSLRVPYPLEDEYFLIESHPHYRYDFHICSGVHRFCTINPYGDNTDNTGTYNVWIENIMFASGDLFDEEECTDIRLIECNSDSDCESEERQSCEVGKCEKAGICSFSLVENSYTAVTIGVKTDDYPAETTWNIASDYYNHSFVVEGGPYLESNTLYETSVDLCMTTENEFCIYDSWNDGICCAHGNGKYHVTKGEIALVEGGDFGSKECERLVFCTDDSDCTSDDCTVGTCNLDSSTCIFSVPDDFNAKVNVTTDNWPAETFWYITDLASNLVVKEEGPYPARKREHPFEHDVPLCPGSYEFCIEDTWGDGICCETGIGSYALSLNNNVIAEGGDFEYKECTQFTVCEEDSDCVSESSCLRKCVNDVCMVDDPDNSILLDGSLKILTDSYPGETSWELTEKPDNTIISCGSFRVGSGNFEYDEDLKLCPDVTYEFSIYDSHGDGICCDYGDGRYEVQVDGELKFAGAQFSSEDRQLFTTSDSTAPSVPPSFVSSVAPSKKTAPASSDSSAAPSVDPSNNPSAPPSITLTAAPSKRPITYLTECSFDSSLLFTTYEVNNTNVASLYNAAVVNEPIIFNDDNATCANVACIARGSHPSCTVEDGYITNGNSSLTAPITMAFEQISDGVDNSDCCTANTCVFGYVETQTLTIPAGHEICFQYGAATGYDWYEVAAVLYDSSNMIVDVKVFRGVETVSRADNFLISETGDYFIRFFSGSYDRNGAGYLGASLQVEAFGYSVIRSFIPSASPTKKTRTKRTRS